MPHISTMIFWGIILLAFLGCGIRLFKDKFSPQKTVNAVVVHKQTVEQFSKYSGNGVHTKYAVTFQIGNKKRSFYVSGLSYRGYRVKQKGKLTYKGSRLIDFT